LEAERLSHAATKGQLDVERDSVRSFEATIVTLNSKLQEADSCLSKIEEDKSQLAKQYEDKLISLAKDIESAGDELAAAKHLANELNSQTVQLTRELEDVKQEYSTYKSTAQDDTAVHLRNITELQDRIRSLEEENLQTVAARDAANKALAEIQAEYSKETAHLKEELQRLELLRENSEHHSVDDQLHQTNELLRAKTERLSELQRELDEIRTQLISKAEQLTFVQEESAALEEELAATKSSLSNLEDVNKDLRNKIQELQADQTALQERCLVLATESDESGDKLNELTRELAAKHNALQSLTELLEAKTQEFRQTSETLEASKRELIDSLERERDQAAATKEQLRVATSKLNAIEKVGESKTSDNVDVGAIQSDRDTLFEQLENEIQEHVNTKQDLERKQSFIEEQREKIRHLEESVIPLKQLVSAKEEELQSQQRRISELEDTLVALQREKESQVSSVLAELDSLKESKSALQDEIQVSLFLYFW
jgi:chromosome segregation ATPase